MSRIFCHSEEEKQQSDGSPTIGIALTARNALIIHPIGLRLQMEPTFGEDHREKRAAEPLALALALAVWHPEFGTVTVM